MSWRREKKKKSPSEDQDRLKMAIKTISEDAVTPNLQKMTQELHAMTQELRKMTQELRRMTRDLRKMTQDLRERALPPACCDVWGVEI